MTERLKLPTRTEVEELDFEQVRANNECVGMVRDYLGKRIVGQEEALDSLGRAIVRCEAGYRDPNRPTGVFVFLGPTGVGKTESAKALAEYLSGDPDNLIRVDCGELTERHSTYRFTGAPPSYVGYGNETLISQDDLRKPNVVLLDEVEKAHPAVHRMLLSVFDSGRLTATQSETGSWRNASQDTLNFAMSYIVMTSNVGAKEMRDIATNSGLGFNPNSEEQGLSKAARGALEKTFQHMPEFLNRVDETVVFDYLGKRELIPIGAKFLAEYSENKSPHAPQIAVTQEAMEYLVDRALKRKQYGARELKRLIDKEVITRASEIVFGTDEWEALIGDFKDGEWVFHGHQRPEEPEEEPIMIPVKYKKHGESGKRKFEQSRERAEEIWEEELEDVEIEEEPDAQLDTHPLLDAYLDIHNWTNPDGQYELVYRLKDDPDTAYKTGPISEETAKQFIWEIPDRQVKGENVVNQIYSIKKRRIR